MSLSHLQPTETEPFQQHCKQDARNVTIHNISFSGAGAGAEKWKFRSRSQPRKRTVPKPWLQIMLRYDLQGRIMMHFSLSTQMTQSLSSRSRSTSLSSMSSTLSVLSRRSKRLARRNLPPHVLIWAGKSWNIKPNICNNTIGTGMFFIGTCLEQ